MVLKSVYAAELVSELDYEKAEKLLSLMGVKDQNAIRQLLGYREDTAGRIMTQEVVSLSEDDTVEDAITVLRLLEEDFESVRYIYLVDEDNKLSGVVTLNQLIISSPGTRLSTLAEEEIVTASPDDDQEDVAEDIAKYNLLAIPVVNDDGKLLGIVTVDDALEVLQEEHEEDLAIAGGRDLGTDDQSSHVLERIAGREMWVVFWAIGLVVLSALAGGTGADPLEGVLLAVAMPVALRGAVNMARYVIDFCLEWDADDEDAPSAIGFALRGIGVGICYAAVIAVTLFALINVLPLDSDSMVRHAMRISFAVAAGVVLLSFVTAPLYLLFVRVQDKAGNDVSGQSLRLCALMVAMVAFVAAAIMLWV